MGLCCCCCLRRHSLTCPICSNNHFEWSAFLPSYAHDHALLAAASLFDLAAMRVYAKLALALPKSVGLTGVEPDA